MGERAAGRAGRVPAASHNFTHGLTQLPVNRSRPSRVPIARAPSALSAGPGKESTMNSQAIRRKLAFTAVGLAGWVAAGAAQAGGVN